MSKEKILHYYLRELDILKEEGNRFAKAHPDAARQLGIDQEHFDPDVARLTESFAYLSARLWHSVEDIYPKTSAQLLNVLYPYMVNPIPSVSIASFDVDYEKAAQPNGVFIDAGIPFSVDTEDTPLNFVSCYPIHYWPLSVEDVEVCPVGKYPLICKKQQTQNFLKITLKSHMIDFKDLNIQSLRFYLNAGRNQQCLFKLLSCSAHAITLRNPDNDTLTHLDNGSIKHVGFDEQDAILIPKGELYNADTLLTEYFYFKEKFHFIDIPLTPPSDGKESLEIFISLDCDATSLPVNKDSFCLHCTPIINRFPKTTEPVSCDDKHYEYLLFPAKFNKTAYDIHSIQHVTGITRSGKHLELPSLFAPGISEQEHDLSWNMRRDYNHKESCPETLCYIHLQSFNPKQSKDPVDAFYADTLCTNHHRPRQLMSAGTPLHPEVLLPIHNAYCLMKPSRYKQPSLTGEKQWPLIAALAFKKLNLLNNPDMQPLICHAIKTISLNDDDDTMVNLFINNIAQINITKSVKHVSDEAWRGFVRGFNIQLEYNELGFDSLCPFSKCPLSFFMVLNHFFANRLPLNTFSMLMITTDINSPDGEVYQCKPRNGMRTL